MAIHAHDLEVLVVQFAGHERRPIIGGLNVHDGRRACIGRPRRGAAFSRRTEHENCRRPGCDQRSGRGGVPIATQTLRPNLLAPFRSKPHVAPAYDGDGTTWIACIIPPSSCSRMWQWNTKVPNCVKGICTQTEVALHLRDV